MKNNQAHKWIYFAQEDLRIAEILFDEKAYTHICFLSQQVVEKSLKGFLIYHKKIPPKVHSLVKLLSLCAKIDSNLKEKFLEAVKELDAYYTPTRYPDSIPGSLEKSLPGESEAKSAFKHAGEIFKSILDLFNKY